MMKKNKIITLFLVISLCFFSGIMVAKALPECSIDVNVDGNSVENDYGDIQIKEALQRKTDETKTCIGAQFFKISPIVGRYSSWTTDSRTVSMFFSGGNDCGKHRLKNIELIFYGQDKKETDGDEEEYQICKKDLSSALNEKIYSANVYVTINKGHVYYIKFIGTFINNKGEEVKKSNDQKVLHSDPGGKQLVTATTSVKGQTLAPAGGAVGDTTYYTGARQNANILYDAEKINCDKISGVASIIALCWKAVMILVPVVLIALGTLDFVKGFTSNSEDAVKKNVNNFVKRTIAALLLLYLPLIVGILVNLFGLVNYNCLFK